MEVWRLSSKRLAAPTFFVRRSPELPLPLTTNNRSRHDTWAEVEDVQAEKRGENKKRSLRRLHFIIRIEYTKTKSCPNDGLRKKSREKILFSYDIPLPL